MVGRFSHDNALDPSGGWHPVIGGGRIDFHLGERMWQSGCVFKGA